MAAVGPAMPPPEMRREGAKVSPMKHGLPLSIALVIFVASVSVRAETAVAQAAGAPSQPARGSAPPAAGSGLAILNRSCTGCHEAAQVKQARPAADWPPIIERMRNNGASISDGDAKLLLNYLVTNYSSHS
jgi:cytochrome c5